MIDSRVTKNHITPSTVKRLGLLYRQKLESYTLVTILGDLVLYRDGIINLETRLVQINIEKRDIIVNFNILLLG
jgi:hypothetical protein